MSEQNTPIEGKPKISHQRWLFQLVIVITVFTFGLWAGVKYSNAAGNIMAQAQKVLGVMSLIQSAYVTEPDLGKLTEGAIEGMLKRLDPHSVYIPAKEQSRINEVDQGAFEGIGVSFIIENELITVVAPIPGSPSDRLGIRSGDKITEIDGISAYGISEEEVFGKLRGPKGSQVVVKIARDNVPELLEFTITRDKIPINSVLSHFMIDDSTGYILLSQFMSTSTKELLTAFSDLDKAGMKRLIFDLRNNQGGRLDEAVSISDMFIPAGHPLVSRRGRDENDRDSVYNSTDQGTVPMYDLIVLINGGSASASEIVAGAVQDLDRGLVIGENSFGKGLVQNQFALKDGGMIRLSTSHWFTPAGRLIQRAYDKGRGEYYAVQYRDNEDTTSIAGRKAYKTLGGRTVYSSNGITPDIKVTDDKITGATIRLMNQRIMFEYSRTLANRWGLSDKSDYKAFLKAITDTTNQAYRITDDDLRNLVDLASKKKIEVPLTALQADRKYISEQLYAETAQVVWNNREYYYNARTILDPVVNSALKQFAEAKKVAQVWNKR